MSPNEAIAKLENLLLRGTLNHTRTIELEMCYESLGYKEIKNRLNNFVYNYGLTRHFKVCFIFLLQLFDEDYQECTDWAEELAKLYIQYIPIRKLKYRNSVLIAMITNPKLMYSRKTVDLYLDNAYDIEDNVHTLVDELYKKH